MNRKEVKKTFQVSIALVMDKRIMIIDDEIDICKEVAAYLQEQGYEAYFATTGEEGFKLIEKRNPHLLLLDIRLPKMDGLEILKQVNERYPNMVVIVISGAQDVEAARKAIEYGACEYITKPIQMDSLIKNFIRPILGE